jgi:hypothetical protein
LGFEKISLLFGKRWDACQKTANLNRSLVSVGGRADFVALALGFATTSDYHEIYQF